LKQDLFWWSEFLGIYNGGSVLNLQEWTEPDENMAFDACLVDCGGVSNGCYFYCRQNLCQVNRQFFRRTS
jgi:hypothetical protein